MEISYVNPIAFEGALILVKETEQASEYTEVVENFYGRKSSAKLVIS